MVYAHHADWYLDLESRRDVIEEPITDVLDISGWDIDKTLRLCEVKPQHSGMDWFSDCLSRASTFQHLRAVLTHSFNHHASIRHYVNMALNNKRQWLERAEVKIKKYLYAIRPLLCAQWVEKNGTQPPMLYHDLLDDLHPGARITEEVNDLVRRKQDLNELDIIPPQQFLNKWINDTLGHFAADRRVRTELPAWDVYNQAFRSIIAAH